MSPIPWGLGTSMLKILKQHEQQAWGEVSRKVRLGWGLDVVFPELLLELQAIKLLLQLLKKLSLKTVSGGE